MTNYKTNAIVPGPNYDHFAKIVEDDLEALSNTENEIILLLGEYLVPLPVEYSEIDIVKGFQIVGSYMDECYRKFYPRDLISALLRLKSAGAIEIRETTFEACPFIKVPIWYDPEHQEKYETKEADFVL